MFRIVTIHDIGNEIFAIYYPNDSIKELILSVDKKHILYSTLYNNKRVLAAPCSHENYLAIEEYMKTLDLSVEYDD